MRDSNGEKTTINDKLLKVALRVCDKRLRDLDDLIDDPNAFQLLVTDEEWKVLGADELNLETLALKKHDDWMNKNEVMQQEKKKQEKAKLDKEKKKKKKKVAKKPKEEEAIEGVEGWEKPEEEDIIDDEDEDEPAGK